MLNVVSNGSQTVQSHQGYTSAENGVHVNFSQESFLDEIGHIPHFIRTHEGENGGNHGQHQAGDANGKPGAGEGQKLAPGTFQIDRLGGEMGLQMGVMHVPIPPLTAETGRSAGKPRRIPAAPGGYPGPPPCRCPAPESDPHPS